MIMAKKKMAQILKKKKITYENTNIKKNLKELMGAILGFVWR